MTGGTAHDDDRSEHDPAVVAQKFEQLFGVSETDLRAKGIDPGQYARDHIRDALKDQGKWDGILPASYQYALVWTKWGFRAFVAMFLGLGFLALSKVSALHWIGIGLASTAWFVAVAMGITMGVYRSKYVQACQSEGISPSWKR